jgi:hypothetical protein
MRITTKIKNLVVSQGRKPRRILTGAFSGLTMEVDLTHQMQFYLGLYERELYHWLERFSRGATVALDIGAAEGEFSLFFLKRTDVRRVLAFEPQLELVERLHRNMRLNGLESDARLTVRSEFVGAATESNQLSLDSLLGGETGTVVAKVDVDGPEADALRGAKQLLAQGRTRWIVETHSLALERECLQILDAAGYRTQVIPNAWWRPILGEMRGCGSMANGHNRWLVAVPPGERLA